MEISPRLVSMVLVGTAIFSIAGGVYFGLFSCGGYVWHRQLFNSVFLVLLFAIIALPPRNSKTVRFKFTAVIVIVLCFVVVRAAASTFYPAAPESIGEFLGDFVLGVKHGPC